MERLIAVGDIHGHYDKLNKLLSLVRPCSNDLLVFLGDYIDRGPDSKGVVDRLIRLQEQFPQTIFLRGNHDQMLLDCLHHRGLLSDWIPLSRLSANINLEADPRLHERNFFSNGGQLTIEQYGGWESIPIAHISFLTATRLIWRHDPFLFVHAGALPEIEAEEQDPFVLLWSRFSPAGQNGEVHVVGHTPVESGYPDLQRGRFMLDTGAAYDGPLTASDVLTRQVWQAR